MPMGERMVRFMTLSFALLGWTFYEMSGGADFAPPDPVAPPRVTHAEPVRQAEGVERLLGGARAAEAPAEVVPASFAGPVVVAGPADFRPLTPEPAVAAAAAPPPERRAVTGSRVNLRAGPGTEHAVLDVLARGETPEVLEAEGGWARVRAGASEGWMALSLLSEPLPG